MVEKKIVVGHNDARIEFTIREEENNTCSISFSFKQINQLLSIATIIETINIFTYVPVFAISVGNNCFSVKIPLDEIMKLFNTQ